MMNKVFLHLLSITCLCKSQGLSVTVPQWSVPTTTGIDDYCLLASGNFSLVFPPLQDNLLSLPGNNNTWVVPSSASAQGVCGDQASELNLRWMDKATDDENLLNLVITRIGRLAGITGVFMRLHTGPDKRGMKEMSGEFDVTDINTLAWPIRYGLSCPSSLMYPLYPAPITFISPPALELELVQQEPVAYLLIENIKLEAFRDQTLVDQYPQSASLEFYRRIWECEFHMSFEWAPIAVCGGLAGLIGFLLVSFLCKSSVGCSDRISSRKFEYEKI